MVGQSIAGGVSSLALQLLLSKKQKGRLKTYFQTAFGFYALYRQYVKRVYQ